MRKASILLAIGACAGSSLSLAQHAAPSAEVTAPSAVNAAGPGSDDNVTDQGPSGFGQIMSVLTGLLQDAAAREATSGSSAASHMLSSDESAVSIAVTPVAGRSTLFFDKREVDEAAAGKPPVEEQDRGRSAKGKALPPEQVPAARLEPPAAQG